MASALGVLGLKDVPTHLATNGFLNLYFNYLLVFYAVSKYFSKIIKLFFFFFQGKASLFNSFGCLGTLFVELAGLELTEICLPLPPKCCTTIAQLALRFEEINSRNVQFEVAATQLEGLKVIPMQWES